MCKLCRTVDKYIYISIVRKYFRNYWFQLYVFKRYYKLNLYYIVLNCVHAVSTNMLMVFCVTSGDLCQISLLHQLIVSSSYLILRQSCSIEWPYTRNRRSCAWLSFLELWLLTAHSARRGGGGVLSSSESIPEGDVRSESVLERPIASMVLMFTWASI